MIEEKKKPHERRKEEGRNKEGKVREERSWDIFVKSIIFIYRKIE